MGHDFRNTIGCNLEPYLFFLIFLFTLSLFYISDQKQQQTKQNFLLAFGDISFELPVNHIYVPLG